MVPPDLQAALDDAPEALAAYQALGDSVKKQHLLWVHSAKWPTWFRSAVITVEPTISPLGSREDARRHGPVDQQIRTR
jgi:hypothetical protein